MNSGALKAVIGGLVWVLCLAGVSAQIYVTEPRETFRGLPGVQVVVEPLKPDAEQDSLTESQLQTDVELRLRKAGIRVLTRQERLATPGGPFLYVNVNTWKSPPGFPGVYIYAFEVRLTQRVVLERDIDIATHAGTWTASAVGKVGAARLRDIREHVGDIVDAFINDFVIAQPPQKIS